MYLTVPGVLNREENLALLISEKYPATVYMYVCVYVLADMLFKGAS